MLFISFSLFRYLPFPFFWNCFASPPSSPSIIFCEIFVWISPLRESLPQLSLPQAGLVQPQFPHGPLGLLRYRTFHYFLDVCFGIFLHCLTLKSMRIRNMSALFVTVFLLPGTVPNAQCVMSVYKSMVLLFV